MNVGDKVVCVDDRFAPEVAALYTALPKKGVVYVVRDVRLGIQPDCRTGDVSLLLVGLVNPRAESRLHRKESNAVIARRLGRTLQGITSKAHKLGLMKAAERLEKMGRENIARRWGKKRRR